MHFSKINLRMLKLQQVYIILDFPSYISTFYNLDDQRQDELLVDVFIRSLRMIITFYIVC